MLPTRLNPLLIGARFLQIPQWKVYAIRVSIPF